MAAHLPIPLLGGAYSAESYIANAQRCVNLYPEKNPEANQPPVPVTHYLWPGLRRLATGVTGAVRGLYTATNGKLYAVIGDTVYYVGPDWGLTVLGTIPTGTSPVSMSDNRTDNQVFLVDGVLNNGWLIDMTTNAFAAFSTFPLNDPSGFFSGSPKVSYLDTFTLFCRPGSNLWYCTQSDSYVLNPLYFAFKTAYPDDLQVVAVVHREVWLIGKIKSEIWYNAGNAQFPFAITPGAAIEYGTTSKYSVAVADIAIFWLGQSENGWGTAYMGQGYEAKRISNHAIEAVWNSYPGLNDAIGYTILLNGHTFYILTFPTADHTWVYDLATGQWFELVWLDTDGNEHRYRGMCHAFAYGTHVVGDWQNGKLYALDVNTYMDDDLPVIRRRGFPHIAKGGNRISYPSFTARLQPGSSASYVAPNYPMCYLRWSDNGGKSWGNPVGQSMGAGGEYLTSLKWNRLGQARDRVYELFWSANMATALNGAFLNPPIVGGS